MEYRTIYRNFVLPLQCLLRRRSTLQWYSKCTQQERMAPAELESLQRQKLAALVRHCAEYVPFYRDLFRERGLNTEQVEDLAMIRNAGIRVDKSTVRTVGDRILSQAKPRPHLYQMATSGSTGVPAFFYKSLETVCRRQALKYRAEDWIGKPIGTRTTLIWGRLPTQRIHARVGRFLYWWYQNYQFLSAFDIGPRQLEEYVATTTNFGAEFIESYVTAVHQMAKVITARKLTPPKLKGILVGGEQLVEEQRQFIEAAFGCPVYNRYGSTEFTNIASECSRREGFHINSDHILVEVVDENDKPVVEQVGEIVVTDLDAYDMPLIRYRIGDRGVMSSKMCSCGRPFPMLKSIDGRTSQRLITSSGREIHDTFFIHSLMRLPGVAKFQVIQKSLELVQVNLEMQNGSPREPVAADVRRNLQTLSDHGIRLDINFVDTIPLNAAGKMPYFVSEVL